MLVIMLELSIFGHCLVNRLEIMSLWEDSVVFEPATVSKARC